MGGANAGAILAANSAPASIAALQQTFNYGFHAAFIVCAGVAAIGILTSLVRGKETADLNLNTNIMTHKKLIRISTP